VRGESCWVWTNRPPGVGAVDCVGLINELRLVLPA
jgi:hypothetical protein